MNRRRLLLLMGGGWKPTQAIQGMMPEFWHDAGSLNTLFQDSAKTTPVTAINDPVGAWADKSGNGVDFLQAGATGVKPIYTVYNGKPCLLTDGNNDIMTATITARASRTLFVVCKKRRMPLNEGDNVISFSASSQMLSWIGPTHEGWRYYSDESGAVNMSGNYLWNLCLLDLVLSGNASLTFYNNGTLETAINPKNTIATSTTLAIGAAATNLSWGNYYIFEVLAYPGVLNDANRVVVEKYFISKYGLKVPPPVYSEPWTSKQVVLAATEVEDNSTLYEPTVMYDADPQVIADDPCYKMWFNQGGFGAEYNICYAESADGITWTRKAGFLITHVSRNCVLKVGATYYLYCEMGGAGSYLGVYTSADGINWVQQSADQLSGITNSTVIVDDDGVWKMLYEYSVAGRFCIFLATSPDGLIWTPRSWTVPVIELPETQGLGGPRLYKVGSTYYLWCHRGGLNNLPTDGVRYKSTDLITWSVMGNPDFLGYILKRSTADEGYNQTAGQAVDLYPIQVGANIYCYYSASSNGTASTGNMRIKLAVAPVEWWTRES